MDNLSGDGKWVFDDEPVAKKQKKEESSQKTLNKEEMLLLVNDIIEKNKEIESSLKQLYEMYPNKHVSDSKVVFGSLKTNINNLKNDLC